MFDVDLCFCLIGSYVQWKDLWYGIAIWMKPYLLRIDKTSLAFL